MKLIKRECHVLTVEHEPNLIGRILKRSNYTKKYFYGSKDYCFYNCYVWYDFETGKEVGTQLSMKLQPLFRLSQKPRPQLKPSDLVEDNLYNQ